MYQGGGWWKWVICASALAGCSSRSGLDPSGGDAGQSSTEEAGSGGGLATSGSGSVAISGSGGSLATSSGGAGGKVGGGGKAGGGGAGAGTGSGGKASGGHGGTGGSCASAPACGGDVTGMWTVASSCLDVSGVVDVSLLGLGCSTAPVTGSRSVAGTFIANADGTYFDQTTTSGEDHVEIAPACLQISGVVVMCERIAPIFQSYGYDSVTCAPAADGRCFCDATFAQAAGLGVPSLEPLANGTFTTSRRTLTLDDGLNQATSYQYCASEGQLTLRPLPTITGTVRGAIVLTDQ